MAKTKKTPKTEAAPEPAQLTPNSRILTDISGLIQQQLAAETAVAEAEEVLKAAKERLRAIQEVALPDALEAADVEEFKTADGIKVSVKGDVSVSITEANRKAAFAWLKKNKLGSLVKQELSVSVPKDCPVKLKKEIDKFLKSNGLTYTVGEAAHTGSVKAALKRALADGVNVPFEPFGLRQYRKATIKL